MRGAGKEETAREGSTSGSGSRAGDPALRVDRVQVRAIHERFEAWKRRVSREAGEADFSPDTPWSREDLEEALGVPVLGTGAGRVVVRIAPGMVAKLPWNAGGVEQNEGEIASWDEADEGVRRWMLPPLDYVSPPGVSIFPEAVVESRAAPSPLLGKAKAAWARLVRLGVGGANTGDAIKTENWGTYEGRLVLLDYAPDADE